MPMSHLAKLQRKVVKDPRLPTPADLNGRQPICTHYQHIIRLYIISIAYENHHIKETMLFSLTSMPSCLYPAVAFSM